MVIKDIFLRLSKITVLDPKDNGIKDDLIDAGILAGLTFFTNLGSQMFISNINVIQAGIQAGLIFFTFLAFKRGLINYNKR